jgi:hypothetical protein
MVDSLYVILYALYPSTNTTLNVDVERVVSTTALLGVIKLAAGGCMLMSFITY